MESTKEIYKENTLFETLKKYIVENATQNKNTKLYFIFDSENTKDYTSASDYNHEILIDLIKEYFLKHFDFDKDSYELKMNLNFYYDMDNIFKANMELEFVVNI